MKMRSRGSILLVVFATLLVVFLMPMRDLTVAQAFAAGQPAANTANSAAAPLKPQIFEAKTANRQKVGGPAPHAALASARSADKNSTELPSRRTASSRTFKTAQGYATEIYPGAINYKTANGAWLPIDNTLVTSRLAGFAYENKGNNYSVYFPSNLRSGPIRFAVPAGWVEFALLGAGGNGSVATDTATYRNVLPGVDVSYTAQNQGVKEKLSLASSLSPSSFTYSLRTSAGLTARQNPSRGIDLLDKSGTVQFSFEPPFVYEAANADGTLGPASLQLGGTTNAQTIMLSIDSAWLSNPARHWPVIVDPTITYGTIGSAIWKQFNGANQDCYLQNGSGSSTSYCNGSSLYAGYSGGVVSRALLQFNVQNSIPQDVTVLDADLATYLYQTASGSPVSVDAMQLTQAWTTAATWNTYDGTHAWTSSGGTFATPAAWTDASVGTTSGYYHWYLAQLVQKWVYGTVANDGILLKTTSESTTNQLSFRSSEYSNASYWPYLKVTYQLGLGDKASDQQVTHRLSDRISLQVDLSSGNLLVKHHEEAIRGTGLDQSVDLYYNNLSPAIWDYGRSWEVNTGWDIWLATNHPDGVNLYGPSGTALHFVKNSDGSFTSPAGLDATLVRNGDLTYTLTFNATQEKYNFSSDGLSFLSDVDRNGNAITFAYNSSGSLASMTDTQGRVTTFSYTTPTGCTAPTSDGFVKKMTDPSGRTYQYGYDSNCNLTTLTDAANKVTSFGYDASFNLTKITDPNGSVTNLSYDSATRVTSITRVTNVSQGTGPTTTYGYNTGAGSCAPAPTGDSLYGYTTQTDANSHVSTYCYDQAGLVLQLIDPNANSNQTSYTLDQHVASRTNALAQTATASFNGNNDLTQLTPPTLATGHSPAASSVSFNTPNTVSGYQYLPSSTVDPQGRCTGFVYDPGGNLTDTYAGQSAPCDGQTGGTHTSTTYQGDPGVSCGAKAGEICSAVDGLGQTTTYSYDTYGNVTGITRPSPAGGTIVTVDALSRISSMTDGKGQKTSYSYDALDRITQILYGGATTCTPSTGNCITFAFDADGNQTATTDNTGTTSYYYDKLNRLTTASLPDTTSACPGSSPSGMTYTYDGVDNLLQSCDSGGTTSYGFDAGNRLTSVAEPGGNCGSTPVLCTTFSYNADGERTQAMFPGGATMTIGYDSNGQITSAVGKDKNGAVLTSFTYSHSNGTADTQRVQSRTETDAVASNTISYSYDQLNRVSQATVTAGSGTSYSYVYDGNGNVTTKTAGTATTSFAYNGANQLCWSYTGSSSNSCGSPPSGATTYSFDANGNETGTSAGAAFSYNPKNQTTAITYGGATLSPLAYSGTGQTQRTLAGGISFDHGQSGLQIATTNGSSTYYMRDDHGNLIGERVGSNHYYYLVDGLGSVVAVISGDGLTIGDRYAYDPFGNTTYHSGSVANPWGYAGGYVDPTGLIKFGNRYYDPATARWTQTDLFTTDPGSGKSNASPYAYAGDDPINQIDQSGDAWIYASGGWSCCWGTIGYWWIKLHLTSWDVTRLTFGWSTVALIVGWAVPIFWLNVVVRAISTFMWYLTFLNILGGLKGVNFYISTWRPATWPYYYATAWPAGWWW
jgi:RHS repeat-associated protein